MSAQGHKQLAECQPVVEKVCGQTWRKSPSPDCVLRSLWQLLCPRSASKVWASVLAHCAPIDIFHLGDDFYLQRSLFFFSSQNTALVSRSVSSTWKIPLSAWDIFSLISRLPEVWCGSPRVFIETISLWECLFLSCFVIIDGGAKVGNNQKRLMPKSIQFGTKVLISHVIWRISWLERRIYFAWGRHAGIGMKWAAD